MADPKQIQSDVPLGSVGRLMGLRVVPPKLQAGEEVKWSERANRLQRRLRAVGGRLFLTNDRLIFGRNKLEALLGGSEWSAPLSELASASVNGGRMKIVRVEKRDGSIERFRIADANQSAAVISAAIRGASPVGVRSSEPALAHSVRVRGARRWRV